MKQRRLSTTAPISSLTASEPKLAVALAQPPSEQRAVTPPRVTSSAASTGTMVPRVASKDCKAGVVVKPKSPARGPPPSPPAASPAGGAFRPISAPRQPWLHSVSAFSAAKKKPPPIVVASAAGEDPAGDAAAKMAPGDRAPLTTSRTPALRPDLISAVLTPHKHHQPLAKGEVPKTPTVHHHVDGSHVSSSATAVATPNAAPSASPPPAARCPPTGSVPLRTARSPSPLSKAYCKTNEGKASKGNPIMTAAGVESSARGTSSKAAFGSTGTEPQPPRIVSASPAKRPTAVSRVSSVSPSPIPAKTRPATASSAALGARPVMAANGSGGVPRPNTGAAPEDRSKAVASRHKVPDDAVARPVVTPRSAITDGAVPPSGAGAATSSLIERNIPKTSPLRAPPSARVSSAPSGGAWADS